jgi:excisionase family DNA binding protein
MTTSTPPHGPRTGDTPPQAQASVPPPAGAPEQARSAERLAYSVDEAASLTGLSRDLLYDEMRRGNLHYLKVGRRRLITRQHLEEFLGIPQRPPTRGRLDLQHPSDPSALRLPRPHKARAGYHKGWLTSSQMHRQPNKCR